MMEPDLLRLLMLPHEGDEGGIYPGANGELRRAMARERDRARAIPFGSSEDDGDA